jgi:hypothetical protein
MTPSTTARKWHRTDLRAADGSLARDDWSLIDPQLGPIARIYRAVGGPRDGQWFWAVQIDEHGRPWNVGTGYAPAGKEAREAVEAIVGAPTPGE